MTGRNDNPRDRSVKTVWRIVGEIEDRDRAIIAQGIAAEAIVIEG